MSLSNLTKVQTVGIGSNIEVVGVITTGQFKSGTSNLHSTGVDLTNLNVSGIATIGGNLSIGGTLTYQDVTNIDSVGLITARNGINVTGGNVTITNDLDVDGHTNLDNTSIAGIVTAQQIRYSSGGGNWNGHPRSVVLGYSGSEYAQLGMGWIPTGTNGQHTSNNTDLQSRLQLQDGLQIYGSGAPVASGQTVSWKTVADFKPSAIKLYTSGNSNSEKLRIDSGGHVMIGNTAAGSLYASGNNLVVGDGGASNQGMTIYTGNAQQGILAFADGTSGGAQQYAGYVLYDHNNDHMLFATGSTTRLQIKDDGQVLLTGNNTGNHMSGFGSNVGGLTIDDVGNQHTGLEVLHGSNKVYLVASSNNSVYLSSYGTGNLIFEHTGGGGTRERLKIDSNGNMIAAGNLNLGRTSNAGEALCVRGPADGDAIRIERAGSYQWFIGNDTTAGKSNLYFKANNTKEVVFPSTGGIAFNGEAATANALDDYEVGNWNSTVQWANGNTTGSYTNTTTVQGTYVKVGNVVHAWIQVYPYNYNNGSDCVILGVTLPFTVSTGGSVSFAPYSGRGNYGGWLTNSTYPRTYAALDASNTRIQPLVTGNENGAGFWGHKSGTVAANASFTATYYSA